jgi:hypothetical protein
MNRILSPGGIVILTVPFFWQIHEPPRDFYRYTKFGLKHLFEKGGFDIIEIIPLTGFFITIAQNFVYYFQRFSKIPVIKVVIILINWGIQYAAKILNRFDNSYEFTCIYGVIARKKSTN